AAAARGGAGVGIDRDAAQEPQVDDQPALADAMAGNAVTAAPDRNRQIHLTGQRDRRDDVLDIEWADDQLGTPVDHPVERAARGIVTRVARGDHRAPMPLSEIREDGCGHGASMTQRGEGLAVTRPSFDLPTRRDPGPA